jgi:exodeoxyribonuclease VII large subunit
MAELAPDKIYTVAQLNEMAGRTLEQQIGAVWVRGEVSGLKLQSSGHYYFSLKDEKSVISVALFKGAAQRQTVKLEEGKQLLVFGTVGIYQPRGSYQMVAQFLLEEGAGRLQQEFERLKRMLEQEGLFARERKVALPVLPQTVAFITSPTGAVWQDFTRILRRRTWGGRVILFPCRVQGAEAPGEIAAQLARADRWPGVELIVVGRGGGSLEDLWAYNTEEVVRAVAAMERPIISAVGHETDVTLCDFAADFRAETPSAAAELIAGYMTDARTLADTLSARAQRAFGAVLRLQRDYLSQLGTRLKVRSPRQVIDSAYQRLDDLAERLRLAKDARLSAFRHRLALPLARLASCDPQAVLARGYAMVARPEGGFVASASALGDASDLVIRWHDGQRSAKLLK